MKNLAILFFTGALMIMTACAQTTDADAILKNPDSRAKVFDSILGDHAMMMEFMNKMMTSEHAMMMMKGNHDMMGMMMGGGNMMQMMKNQPEMRNNMMNEMMKDGQMMSSMMNMMHQNGMMSDDCYQSSMNMMGSMHQNQ